MPLTIALLGLSLFALSPTITAGSSTLFQYSERWWGPLATFRASGRLFWPVFYAVIFGMLVTVLRLGKARARILLIAAVIVQLVDVSATYRGLQLARAYRFTNPLHDRFWEIVPRQYAEIVLFPTSMCSTAQFVAHEPFSLLAGHYGLPINAGAAARTNSAELQRYCRVLEFDVSAGIVSKNALYVLRRDLAQGLQRTAKVPMICLTIDGYGVCAAQDSYAKWQDFFDVMYSILPSLDEMMRFYTELDHEYQSRLRRPPRPVTASTEDRVSALMRYVWYRRGGCDRESAENKVLRPSPAEVRICGDPFRGRDLPTVEDLFAIRMQLESRFANPQSTPIGTTHVDAEGEAAWIHRYLTERLNGRDAFGAREAVLNTVRAIARDTVH